jgi:uncharacterized protein YajQ (UPF0234 family)
MPSFDFTSEADMVALKNAIDVTSRQIDNRYDFKGTSAKVELNEKDKVITLWGDSDFQLDQIKDLLFPAMEKKEKESVKRLDHQKIISVSGNKVKQEMKIRMVLTVIWRRRSSSWSRMASSRFRPRFRVRPCAFRAQSAMTCRLALP